MPTIYDLKFIIQDINWLKDAGLRKLSVELNCQRTGQQHQAGFDSFLTLVCYFKMRQLNKQFLP